MIKNSNSKKKVVFKKYKIGSFYNHRGPVWRLSQNKNKLGHFAQNIPNSRSIKTFYPCHQNVKIARKASYLILTVKNSQTF